MVQEYCVITVVGKDRVGLVEEIAAYIQFLETNIEESRMAILGDEFAVIMLVAGSAAAIGNLLANSDEWEQRFPEYHIGLRKSQAPKESGTGIPYIIETVSLDFPGIVHAVTQLLRENAINIQELETETGIAPFTGTPLFRMKVHVVLPTGRKAMELRELLTRLGAEKDIDITIEPEK